MFWDYFRDFRRVPQEVADLLPWVEPLDRRIVRCKDESYLSVWRVNPRDMNTMTEAEQDATMEVLHEAWKPIGAGWGMWMDLVRHPARLTPLPSVMDGIIGAIDVAHQADYMPTLYDQELYLTIARAAPSTPVAIVNEILYTHDPDQTGDINALEEFREGEASIVGLIQRAVRTIEAVEGDALATYIHTLVSDHDQPVRMPAEAWGMDYWVTDVPLSDGLTPKLGRRWLMPVSIKRFPPEVWAHMLEDLYCLPFGYRWTAIWLPQDAEKTRREFDRQQKRHASHGDSIAAAVVSALINTKSRLKNKFAEFQADDTDDARFDLQTQHVSYGDWSVTILLSGEDVPTITQQAIQVESICRSHGLVTVREGWNALAAWLHTLPGLSLSNPRRFRLSSANALALSPLHRPWEGKPETPVFKASALTLAKTSQCMPFWLTLHSEDVGHVLVFGPTGAGKTALLTFLAVQHLARYQGARLRTIDYKRASRSLYLCLQAPYRDFARDRIAIQPYAHIDDGHDRAWAFDWTMDRLHEANVTISPAVQIYVMHALEELAKKPLIERTLSQMLYTLTAMAAARGVAGVTRETMEQIRLDQLAVKQALETYTQHGAYGYIFDSGVEDTLVPVEAFETQGLLNTPRVVPAVVSALWHRMYRESQMGLPTVTILHEASRYLKYPAFVKQIDEDLRILRDKRWSLWLETQDATDFDNSEIRAMLLNNCKTRLLLPNPAAMTPAARPAYEALGLFTPQIEQIAKATPRQDIFVQCPEGSALIHLPLTPLDLAVCGSSTPEDHQMMDTVLALHGPAGFLEPWLECKGVSYGDPVRDARHGAR